MDIVDKSNLGKYVLFFDADNELRAGKIYDMENLEVLVHSLRISNRGESKLYYYRVNEADIFNFVSKESAVQFLQDRKYSMNEVVQHVDRDSNWFVRQLLIAIKDEIDFSVQQNNSHKYDNSLDNFGLGELDYKMLSLILSKSEFTSLYARRANIYLSELMRGLFLLPSISDYYIVASKLVNLQQFVFSISRYRDGSLKKGKFDDILNKDIVTQTNWRFVTGLEFKNSKPGGTHVSVGLNISPYVEIIELMVKKKSSNQIKLVSTKKISLFEYLLNRVMSELVSNNDNLVIEFKEFKAYDFFGLDSDEKMHEELVSVVKDLCNITFLKIDYLFKGSSVELKLKEVDKFNRYFFKLNEDYINVGDWLITLSNMVNSGE